MWLKDIPVGTKVTDKLLRRVLISSVCSILLCMACLVGTTWAWFTVSIENNGNEIKIGEPKINMTVDGESCVSGTALFGSENVLQLAHGNVTDDFDKKSTLYVTLTLQCGDETSSVYVVLNEENGYSYSVNIHNENGEPCRHRRRQ